MKNEVKNPSHADLFLYVRYVAINGMWGGKKDSHDLKFMAI